MVRKIIIAIMVLVFLTGLCFFLYPYAQGALIDREIQENAEDFHSRVEIQPTTGNASVDPKTVQYLAGHENSKITMDIYAKVKYNRPDDVVKAMGGAFAQWNAVAGLQ